METPYLSLQKTKTLRYENHEILQGWRLLLEV